MVVIRLARGGAKKRPFYKIVVADSRKPLKGRFIEKLGYYNPFATGGEVRIHLDIERLNYWQSQGAQLSDRLRLVVKQFKEPETAGAKTSTEKKPKKQPAQAKETPKATAKSEAQVPEVEKQSLKEGHEKALSASDKTQETSESVSPVEKQTAQGKAATLEEASEEETSQSKEPKDKKKKDESGSSESKA